MYIIKSSHLGEIIQVFPCWGNGGHSSNTRPFLKGGIDLSKNPKKEGDADLDWCFYTLRKRWNEFLFPSADIGGNDKVNDDN